MDYTLKDFEEGVEHIYNNIQAIGQPFNRVVGVTRGGLFLAARLSYKLDIPMTAMSWSTRDSTEKESVAWIPEDINNGMRILLVDDIIDSGVTVKEIIQDWRDSVPDELDMENLSVACCVLNTDQDYMPDFWHKTIERSKDDSWINFCWEKK
jgi:hypoxanthine phosphoribosyltransferase